MKIISWNMNRRKHSWDYLLASLDPDIALLQETATIPVTLDSAQISQATVKNGYRNSVYLKTLTHSRLQMPETKSYDGLYPSGMGTICAKIDLTDLGPLFTMCIYGNMSFSPGLAYPLLGVISLFVSMLRNVHDAEHIILSGDFNMDRRLDDNPTGTRFAKKGQRVRNAFFDAILDLGFHDCVKKFYPDYIQTYRAARGDYPWQLDHMFATEALYNQLESVHVVADAATLKASDHNPIVAEFKIG